jgi:regulator of nucleoside diphosphate kinase
MKPIISESVYHTLHRLISNLKTLPGKALGEELSKAEIVKDEALQSDVVSLNSIVEFEDVALNRPIRVQIVLPEEEDLAKRKVSVFAPISVALIGFKQSYSFQWNMPTGTKTLKIIEVRNESV